MSVQRDVQKQNASTEAEIRALGKRFAQDAVGFAWLHAILRENGLNAGAGLLVRLSEIPDQGGQLVAGIWLTPSGEFMEFRALLSREGGELEEIESFVDVTTSLVVQANQRGTGQSLGFLALKLLAEANDG